MNYFAYGSNMSLKRLRQRVPSARKVGVFSLPGYQLRFHKVGKDGSAKCNAFFTGDQLDGVQGVVFTLDLNEIALLDTVEGLGRGYEKQHVRVLSASGDEVEAFTYIATNINDALLPFSWYRHHVLTGARDANLSPDYLAKIERVETIRE
jgi:gamma-glutamylcyclotransferase